MAKCPGLIHDHGPLGDDGRDEKNILYENAQLSNTLIFSSSHRSTISHFYQDVRSHFL